jgi:hypothetical protein
MNEVAFNKVIKKLILPKFPWLVDYEVLVEPMMTINDYPDRGRYYRVNYFFVSDWDESVEFDYDEWLYKRREVKDLTKTLFMALGFDKNQKLEGVEFYNIEHK